MRKVACTIILGLSALVMFGQDVTGQWNGILKVPGAQLRLVFHVEKTETGYASTMDSPDELNTGGT